MSTLLMSILQRILLQALTLLQSPRSHDQPDRPENRLPALPCVARRERQLLPTLRAPTANVAGVSGGGWAGADSSAERPSWWDRPWFIVLMLFLVLGPLALPLLWRSRQFSPGWKIALTVLVTVLTGWLCWKLWLALQQTAAMLDQIQKQL